VSRPGGGATPDGRDSKSELWPPGQIGDSMSEPTKKLTLSKETLRTLDDQELTDVVGGKSGICVDTVVCDSGVCRSVVCNSGALCQSAVC